MGHGERQQESDVKAVEEECLKPPTNKDPEKAAYNPKQGIRQKLRSTTIPLLYVLIGGAILVTLIIIFAAVLSVRDSQGNAKDPARLETLTGEKPETKFVTGSTAADCLVDWVLYRGKCYYFSDKMDSWNNSQNFCKSYNSSLAIIYDEIEMKFINLLHSNYWIGLSRTQDDSSWIWTNGTFYSEKQLFNITREIPDPRESEHVYKNHEGFKSFSGKYENKWICSKRLSNDFPQYI